MFVLLAAIADKAKITAIPEVETQPQAAAPGPATPRGAEGE